MLKRLMIAGLALGLWMMDGRPAAAVQYIYDDTNTIPATSVAANSRVVFDVSGTTLTITLSNFGFTGSGNGALLSGVVFNTNAADQTIADITPTATAAQLYDKTAGTLTALADITNKYIFVNKSVTSPKVVSAIPGGYQYALTSTAAGVLANQLWTGGSGGDDYDIAGSGGCFSVASCATSSGSSTPQVAGTATFVINLTAAFAITSMAFLYSSAGNNTGGVVEVVSAPEPMSMVLMATALIGLAIVRRARG